MKQAVSIVKIKWDFDKVNDIAENTHKDTRQCQSAQKERNLKWLSLGYRWNPKNLASLHKHTMREDGTHINKSDLFNAILEYYFEEVENDKR
jgi:hypothetical protein